MVFDPGPQRCGKRIFHPLNRELDARLAISELGPSAAEAHGMLCAMLCGGEPRAVELWIAELLGDADAADPATGTCQRSLQELAARTRTGIADTLGSYPTGV